MTELEQAVKFFVYSKFSLENKLNNFYLADRISVLLSRIFGIIRPSIQRLHYNNISINPCDFVKFCLPFSEPQYSYSESLSMEIDPFLGLGGTYNKKYPNNPDEISKNFDELNKLTKYHANAAQYSKIGSIPLFVAHEGKNRVSAYQTLNKKIRAYVTQTEYPQPEHLRLHHVSIFNLFVLSFKNGATLKYEVLPFQDFTMPLLKTYGVEFGDRIPPIKASHYLKQWWTKRSRICKCLMKS